MKPSVSVLSKAAAGAPTLRTLTLGDVVQASHRRFGDKSFVRIDSANAEEEFVAAADLNTTPVASRPMWIVSEFGMSVKRAGSDASEQFHFLDKVEVNTEAAWLPESTAILMVNGRPLSTIPMGDLVAEEVTPALTVTRSFDALAKGASDPARALEQANRWIEIGQRVVDKTQGDPRSQTDSWKKGHDQILELKAWMDKNASRPSRLDGPDSPVKRWDLDAAYWGGSDTLVPGQDAYVLPALVKLRPKLGDGMPSASGLAANASVHVVALHKDWVKVRVSPRDVVSLATDQMMSIHDLSPILPESSDEPEAPEDVVGYVKATELGAQPLRTSALTTDDVMNGPPAQEHLMRLATAWALSPEEATLGQKLLEKAATLHVPQLAVEAAAALAHMKGPAIELEADVLYGCQGDPRKAAIIDYEKWAPLNAGEDGCASYVSFEVEPGDCSSKGTLRDYAQALKDQSRALRRLTKPRLRIILRNVRPAAIAPPDRAVYVMRTPGPYLQGDNLSHWREGEEDEMTVGQIPVGLLPPSSQAVIWIELDAYVPQTFGIRLSGPEELQGRDGVNVLDQLSGPASEWGSVPSKRTSNNTLWVSVPKAKMEHNCGE